MHFGSTENDVYDAHLFDDHLYEIANCHKFSKGCFFLVSANVYFLSYIAIYQFWV